MNQNTKYRNCCFVSGPVLSPCLLKAIQGWSIPVFVQPPTPYSLERIRRIEDSEAVSLIGGEDCVVIMNWEASLSFIVKNLPSERLDWVNTFKNKAFFRELVKDLYPDLFYVELTRDNLLDFEFPESVDRVVIKPCLGTASIGIRMVEKGEEWGSVVNSVLEDIDRASENMNSTMLNDSCFVVEEFVEGDEFACDGFWDGEGKTVITGIYQHPFASSWDVSDTVYYTSVDVVVETIEPTKRVLEYIGDKLGIKRFPFHFEFRRFDNKIFPIELNPLRFGQVALPDITEYCFDFNPYDLFFTDKAPNWDFLLSDVDNSQVYGFVLADIPKKYKSGKYLFDEEGFCKSFGNRLLNYLPSNPEITPFFGVAHVVVDNVEEMLEYLNLDFERFLINRD